MNALGKYYHVNKEEKWKTYQIQSPKITPLIILCMFSSCFTWCMLHT